MRHYDGTMEDRTSSAEISRQGAFRVDSNTNTFVYLACVNMAEIGITVHGVKKRETLRRGMELKRKGEGLGACRNNQSTGRCSARPVTSCLNIPYSTAILR